ncbi:uncharacterized protein BX663DRAFT_519176 [Cokeromyces recurvatus]|uniref:uncharacterized protein n=1 Tax=Cokeromyces recurvatus TaxID=90255 RepID=UPI00221F5931|nr:uncharacterized protein BX663DRAFT_519176 [Cokeromyces recurvatus]KAI7899976.1 hypothetical protein BX663DRAFT_519176 [Cokeromyces recurvatus]
MVLQNLTKVKNSLQMMMMKTLHPYNITSKEVEEPANMPLIKNISCLSYEEVKDKYGSQLHIKGSSQLQEEQLYIGIPPGTALSPNLVTVLKEIIRGRSQGVYQASLTKLLNLDSRSTGHYCKSLEEKGAITRSGVSINSMFTNICVHARFHVQKSKVVLDNKGKDKNPGDVPYNVNIDGKAFSQKDVLDALVTFAKDASNQVVVGWDVLHALGFNSTKMSVRKWFNRTVDEICLKGYFRKMNVCIDDTGIPKRCLQLLKTPEETQSNNVKLSHFTSEKAKFPIRIKSTKNNVPIVHALVDSSLERQCFQIIDAAGSKGVTQSAISLGIQATEQRILSRILERMVELKGEGYERFGVVRYLEFEGRMRRYRYYTYAAYQATQNVDIEIPPLPESEVDESKLTEKNIFVDVPHTQKGVNNIIKNMRKDGDSSALTATGKSKKKPEAKKGRPRQNVEPTTIQKNTKRGRPPASATNSRPSKKSKNITDNQSESNTSDTLDNADQPVHTANSEEDATTSIIAKPSNAESSTAMDMDNNITSESSLLNPSESQPTTALMPSTLNNIQEPQPILQAQSSHTTEQIDPVDSIQDKQQTQQIQQTQKEPKKKTIIDYFSKVSKPSNAPVIPATKSAPTSKTQSEAASSNSVENMSTDSASDLVESSNEPLSVNVNNNSELESTLIILNEDKPLMVETVNLEIPNTSSISTQETADPGTCTPPSKKELIPKHHHVNISKQVNQYLQTRLEVVNAVLQETPIVEMGKPLKDAYLKKCEELNVSKRYNICNKTLARTVDELVKQGLAKIEIAPCPLLNGKILKRKLAVRHDIDTESEEYHSYIRTLQDRKIFLAPSYSICKVETIDIPVERLDERIERMKDEHINSQGDSRKAEAFKQHLEKYAKNLKLFGRKYEIGKSSSWPIRSLQLGWIRARMVRSKILHQFLFDLFAKDENLLEVDKVECKISLRAIMNNMTILLLCQMIGVGNPTDEVINFVQDPKNASVILADIPKKIKGQLFTAKNRFRKRLIDLLTVLEYIGIVTPYNMNTNTLMEETSPLKFTGMAVEYKLNNLLVIRDRKRIGQPIVREHTIVSKSDLNRFWSELKYACTNPEIKDIPEHEQAPEPTDLNELMLFRSLYHYVNWTARSVFNSAQRKVLNSYIDKTEMTTPLDNPVVIRTIADSLKVKVSEVHSYYQKVENAIESKREFSERKKVERRLVPYVRRKVKGSSIRDKRRVVTLSNGRAFQHIGRPKGNKIHILTLEPELETHTDKDEQALTGNEPRDQLPFLDDIDKIPVLQNDTNIDIRKTRRKRTTWTAQDNELLVLSQIVLRKRATNRRFLWAAVKQIFPDKSLNSCRNHFDKLMLKPSYVELFESNSLLWEHIYEEGIQSGELQDHDPEEIIHFDLLGFVTYFIKKMVEDKSSGHDKIRLPRTLEELDKNYTIIKNNNEHTVYFEDLFHERPSITAKQLVLYDHTYTLRRYHDNKYDQPDYLLEVENDKFKRQCSMFQSYALMSLITPIEVFDPFFSYSILKKFPQEVHDKMLNEMNKNGILIKKRKERALPGTLMSLSAKFFNTMVGQLPENMFKQAVEYEKFLSAAKSKVRFSAEFVSSGMMACLLNLISENKVLITMANLEKELKRIELLPSISRLIDASLIQFEIDIEKVNDNDEFMSYIPSLDKLHLKTLNTNEFKNALSSFLLTQDQAFNTLSKYIVDLLYQEAELGLSLYQLKLKLNNSYSDKDILRALQLLCSNDPALVCRVGFNIVRYIHIAFINEWAIINKNIVTPSVSEKTKERMIEANIETDKKPEKEEIIIPCLWTDVNGHATDMVIKGCKDAIIDIVLRKPGITESDIYRHLSSGLTRREIQELLNNLVEQKALKQTQIIVDSSTQTKPSIFGKKMAFRCTNDFTIEKSTQTCFWVTPQVYMAMS